MGLQWLPCQVPLIIGSVLGLTGSVSVYCDWVRWKVWSATSTPVWQHVTLFTQVRQWSTLACCWDVEQPTNQHLRLARTSSPLDHQTSFCSTERRCWRGERERSVFGCRWLCCLQPRWPGPGPVLYGRQIAPRSGQSQHRLQINGGGNRRGNEKWRWREGGDNGYNGEQQQNVLSPSFVIACVNGVCRIACLHCFCLLCVRGDVCWLGVSTLVFHL